jgi:hypothetical protein
MPNEPKRRARPILLDRATWLAAQRATWQVATIAKRMVEHPDSTASAALSAGMAGGVQDLIADTAKSSGPAAIRNPLHEPRTPNGQFVGTHNSLFCSVRGLFEGRSAGAPRLLLRFRAV